VEVDELSVVQLVHDVYLLLDQLLLHSPGDRDELGRIVIAGGSLAAPVDHAKRACAYNSPVYIIILTSTLV
jgi:hypothetical protein